MKLQWKNYTLWVKPGTLQGDTLSSCQYRLLNDWTKSGDLKQSNPLPLPIDLDPKEWSLANWWINKVDNAPVAE